jgi:hypothetical protein
MNEEEQVELLSRVDIFESLSEEEIREILRDLLQRNAEINLSAAEVFYTPQQPDGKLFILTKGRVRLYKMEASREFTLEVVDAGRSSGRWPSPLTPSGSPTPRPWSPPSCSRWSVPRWSA